jgi:hypothetical protein
MPIPSKRLGAGVALAAVIVSTLTLTLDAFGAAGHRIVGTLAELYLKDSRALKEVRRILPPGQTLADASVWPDTIKDPLYEDADTAIFRLNHPGHETYHYANLPFQAERYALDVPGARPTDLVQMTRESIRVLQTGKGMFTPREALRLLAHFVGDLHQPLHVGNAFVSSSGPLAFVEPRTPAGWRPTLGGNALVYGPEHRFNLHSYWDSHAVNITMQNDDVAAYAHRLFTEVQPAAAWTHAGEPDSWPAQWATEALMQAKEVHRGVRLVSYLGPDEAKRTAYRWLIEQPADYDVRARIITRQQLAAGGYRLASVLRAIWPD